MAPKPKPWPNCAPNSRRSEPSFQLGESYCRYHLATWLSAQIEPPQATPGAFTKLSFLWVTMQSWSDNIDQSFLVSWLHLTVPFGHCLMHLLFDFVTWLELVVLFGQGFNLICENCLASWTVRLPRYVLRGHTSEAPEPKSVVRHQKHSMLLLKMLHLAQARNTNNMFNRETLMKFRDPPRLQHWPVHRI